MRSSCTICWFEYWPSSIPWILSRTFLAEVSNLTDLSGPERSRARGVLRKTISILNEVEVRSAQAADDALYEKLGLVDAGIGTVARNRHCAVLTDDLDLYLFLGSQNVDVIDFTHLRAREWRV
jgi:uncharacterized protein YacL